MKKNLLLVEGPADLSFFKSYLKHLFPELKIDEKAKKISLESEKIKIVLYSTGGFANIITSRPAIEMHVDEGYDLLVIQDTDSKAIDHGGLEARIKYLEGIKESTSFTFETFLLPNHDDDGDLETLLMSIANKTEFKASYDCYKALLECKKNFADKESFIEMSKEKSIIYDYEMSYNGKDKAKEKNREYDKKFWDFNHISLMPLKKFLNDNIT